MANSHPGEKVDDLKFKTPEKIKLRVSQADETNESEVAGKQPTEVCEPISAATTTTAMVKANDPDDLLDVISDPHAHEDEWVSACHALDKQKRQSERDVTRNKKSRRRAWCIGAALMVSAAIGAASYFHLGPFALPEVDFKPYMSTLQHEIKSHWHPPAGSPSTNVIVHFKVLKNGEIQNIGFDRLSRISESDAAALKSVIESMPTLPPLPKGAPESVDVQFTFESDVINTHKNPAPKSE